jgi:hypothetical protein
MLQTHVNGLAKRCPKDRVKQARSYLKSICDEAVEQEFLVSLAPALPAHGERICAPSIGRLCFCPMGGSPQNSMTTASFVELTTLFFEQGSLASAMVARLHCCPVNQRRRACMTSRTMLQKASLELSVACSWR